MKKKEENMKTKEESTEIKKLCFLPKDQDYLISLIGTQSYNQLLEACIQWNILVTKNSVNFTFFTNRHKVISELLEDTNFKTIITIHYQIKGLQEDKQGVIPLLIDLIQHQQYDFLIPHMFLTGKILEGYHNVHFTGLGFPADIAKIIEFQAGKLDPQETEIIGESDDN